MPTNCPRYWGKHEHDRDLHHQTEWRTSRNTRLGTSSTRRRRAASYLSRFVGQQCAFRGLFSLGARLELRQVPVVIALHLEIEDFRLSRGGRRYEVGVKKPKDAIADGAQLLLNLGPVVLDRSDVLLVSFTLLLLLDG